jgi:chromosome segregation ATPase
MAEILRATRDEESKRRDDVAVYQLQQQVDDLRRQLRESLARQQWLEDIYKNTEGTVAQLKMAQERHTQDIAQTLQVRQIEEGRIKQQIGELAQKVEEPLKPIRDLRAQIGELIDTRRQDRERTAMDGRQFETVQSQIRQLVAQIGLIADGQRQLRDLIHELDAVNAETRQEIQRVAEMQRMEEQRLRRQGAELQELVETLRTQVTEVTSRSGRVEDVRRALLEQIEAVRAEVGDTRERDMHIHSVIARVEKLAVEHHADVQERAETVRAALAAEISEIRQLGEQRMERYINRFQQLEDRIREVDQKLGEQAPHLDLLYRRDEEIESVIDALEERQLREELETIEAQVEEMRQRRAKKQADAAQKASLVRSVREARPHIGPQVEPAGSEGPK